jgi:argininosuccinate lyase
MREIASQREVQEMSLDELREFSRLIDNDVYPALSLERTLNSKSQIGGTAHAAVDSALKDARNRAR